MSPRATDEDFEVIAEFRAALRRFLRVSEEAARRHGLTPRQHLLLLMIQGAPDGSKQATVRDLSERLQLAQSTVTELVHRAQAAGLVRRTPSNEDGRVVHVTVTPSGLSALRALHAELRGERSALTKILARLPAGG